MTRSLRFTLLASMVVLLPTSGAASAPLGCPDADGDGVCDQDDNCPADYNPDQTDLDGDSEGDACDADDDNDGIADEDDNCPLHPNFFQNDDDSDGLGNRCDPCRYEAGTSCSSCNCLFGGCTPCPGDWDCDGVADVADSCPCVYNTGQVDTDADGIGDSCDACIDGDGDGYGHVHPDYAANACGTDNCPYQPNPTQADNDGDGMGNSCDNCAGGPGCEEPCPGWLSCDPVNGLGCFLPNQVCVDTGCDPAPGTCVNGFWDYPAVCTGHCITVGCHDPAGTDLDGDGDEGTCDNCPLTPNPGQGDSEGDGVGDACDNCVSTPNLAQGDADGDGIGNVCDGTGGVILIGFEQTIEVMWGGLDSFDSWNLYRGDLGLLLATGDYTQEPGSNLLALRECGLADPSLEDSVEPSSGGVAFYLVTGNAGGFETNLGVTGEGTVRPHSLACGPLPN